MSDGFLDRLNDEWVASFAPLPFSDRPCGRLDAAYRQRPDLSEEDIEILLAADNYAKRVGP